MYLDRGHAAALDIADVAERSEVGGDAAFALGGLHAGEELLRDFRQGGGLFADLEQGPRQRVHAQQVTAGA